VVLYFAPPPVDTQPPSSHRGSVTRLDSFTRAHLCCANPDLTRPSGHGPGYSRRPTQPARTKESFLILSTFWFLRTIAISTGILLPRIQFPPYLFVLFPFYLSLPPPSGLGSVLEPGTFHTSP
jgi:hypothetical protein